MTLSTRPLTEIEKRTLSEAASVSLPSNYLLWAVYCLFGWLVSIALLGKIDFYFQLKGVVGPWLLIFVSLFWVAACLYMGRRPIRSTSKYAELCRTDLADGVVQLLDYSATEAIRVEEFEDEGSHYFLRLTDGSVLFLSGQYLYDDEEVKKFPCTEFTVIVAPHSKINFGVNCRGNYLPPSKELKAFRSEMFERGAVPEDLSVLKIPWNELEARYS